MRTLLLIALTGAQAWGHFCPDLMQGLLDADYQQVLPVPGDLATLQDDLLPRLRADVGSAVGKEAARMELDLGANRPLLRLMEKVIEGTVRQGVAANRFDPSRHILLQVFVDTTRLVVALEDGADHRNNPWDSAYRRARTRQGLDHPVPAIWETIVALDLPYQHSFSPAQGNRVSIGVGWNVRAPRTLPE